MPETRIRQLRKFFRTYYRARVRLRRGAFGGRIGEVIGLCVRSKAEIEKVREKYGQPPSLYTLLVDLYPGDEKRTRVAPSNVKVLISGEEARLF
ncbi:MAG: hypothetical protein HYZ61_02605 [Candidatus Andersenbacteria bacterium]|nr:hypothetical protein [Candidatus Andersenbacteria bacterium]